MEKTYDAFIELTPGYESVVDISADAKSKDFWSRYIVNKDMVDAVRLLAKSLHPDNPSQDVWHFWIKGAYGTGKTYSAIVIKHLLQDDYAIVESFLNKNKLFYDVKLPFLAARKKGPYYVKFRSGECKQLNTSNKLLFQLEQSVREILAENKFEYTGKNSLIEAVQKTVSQFAATLQEQFDNGEFPEYWGTYDTFDDFYDEVQAGNVIACSYAQEILQTLNIGLATDLNTFKEWIKDIFDGNAELAKTGMFIIWDEFTDYIRYNDLDIIQQLSMFSKEVPFFIIYVMHEYPGLFDFDKTVSEGMDKADARFHKIDISLSEPTTLKLIGESINVRDGMKSSWDDICDELYSSISGSVHQFVGDPDSDVDSHTLKQIFPVHPMTVNMVSKVAGLAASNRSIFEFLKSSGDDGFRAYIQKNGIEKGWKWVTPDYLWDYFFVNNLGGKKELSQMAVDTIKHYNKVKSQISDERMLRVFKTAMLLLATIGSGRSLKKSKGSKGLQSTEKSLYDCFAGALSKEEIHEYLEILSSEPLNLIVLAKDPTEVSRIELPYAGTGGELEAEIEKIKKVNTPAKMLGTDMLIGASLKKQLADGDKAVLKRLAIDTCWGSTQQIDYKYGELKKTVEKTFHKFGMLVIAVPDSNEIERVKKRAAELISKDDTHRMMVCVLRYPLKQELFDEWYNLTANASLAQKTAASVNADSYKTQAEDVLGAWVSTALGKDMDIIYGDVVTHTHSKNGILSEYEKIVFKVFPAAPETIIRKNTLYKSSGTVPAYYGVSKTTLDTKNLSDPKQRNFNQQWQDCVDILQDNEENIFDAEKIEDIIEMHETRVSRSMAAMCNTINQSMTSGTVFLTDLWEALQREIGFYDTGICCYLLGFAMHYYTGKYTWFDGNNAHKLDMDSVPVMVVSMVQGKASGMKLSSESDIEKRFKDITRRIFSLSPDEAGDIYDCRKNIKVKITSLGQPLWAIKYIDEKEFAGVKQAICDIIDQYSNFVLENGNQNDVIEDIVNLIKVNAKVYISMLAGILKAPWDMAQGMKNYIFEISPKAKDICNKYGFSVDDLINTLARSLEEEKWQWREGEIAEATDNLLIDLSLVGIVNSALDGKAKTVDKIRDTLANYLDYIQIPGCVYASLSDPWAETIDVLHDIAINKWASLSKGDKEHILEGLNKSIKLALENISHPINVLKQYITTNKMGEFSDDEYLKILESLPKEPYSQSEHSFKTNIRKTIEDLDYSKKAKQILEIWKTKTNTKSVEEWSVQNIMPIKWVCPDYNSIFSVVRSLNLHERVDLGRLENALVQIEDADLSILSNKEKVDRQFVINVSSEKYMNLLLPHLVELKNYLQDCVTRDYNKWDTRIVDIRKKVDAYIVNDLRAEVSEKAKERVKEIDDINTIRDKLYSILEHSPEACLLLLDE